MSALLLALVACQIAGVLLADGIVTAPQTAIAAPTALVASAATVPNAALVAGIIALVAGVVRRGPRARAVSACVVAACAGAHAHGLRLDDAQRGRPSHVLEVTFDARVLRVDVRDERASVDLLRLGADADDTPLPRRVRLSGEAARTVAAQGSQDTGRANDGHDRGSATRPADCLGSLLPADVVRLRARLRAPTALQNPGGTDGLRSIERAGIGAVGRLADPQLCVLLDDGHTHLRQIIEAGRASLRDDLFARGPRAGLIVALALGDRRGLDRPTREAWAALGITHLLSVSGLHLVLVAAGAFGAIRRIATFGVRAGRGDARRVALVGALLAAAFYALLAGFDVPVQRSLVFVGCVVLAFLTRRPVRAPTLLAGASMIVLAIDPAALFDVGAQLSFAASAALLLALRAASERPADAASARIREALRDGLSTSALATAATAPILALRLGVTSVAGLIVNLVMVPWCGIVLLPASLLATLLAPFAACAPVAAWIDGTCAIAEVTNEAVRVAASFVPRIAPPAAPATIPMVLVGLALAVATLRATRPRTRLALAAIAAVVPAWIPPPALDPAPPRLVAFDVGQGDATLVQGREGALLVDGGVAMPGGFDTGSRILLPALRALGVRRLDAIAVTHADLDHRGGVPAILDALPVGELWLPFGARDDPAFSMLRAAATRNGVGLRETGEGGAPARLGDLVVTPLWPPLAFDASLARDNDRSLVLRVVAGARRVLLAGDLEMPGETALLSSGADLRADVSGLGHHGSRTSSSARWLDAVSAQVSIASSPCEGRFGMPHAEAVRRVRAQGSALWWTGRDGAVLVALDGPLVVLGHGRTSSACPRVLTRREVPMPSVR